MDTARTVRTVSTLLYVAAILVAVFAGGHGLVSAVAAVGAVLLAAVWVATGRMIRAAGDRQVVPRGEGAGRRLD